ncbi:FtsX-like permease family protein [Lentzea xinjiangensis]|uniref:FtsX-like permease family protein n=1 Tax=Lentzea xinjiangensis TaxID=402600 RepID=UPI0015A52119|nr:ABC transporter permease [Lentzea xinjiangensis]
MIRTQLSGIGRRPGRLVLTGLSVLVACFLVFGAFLARDIAVRATADALSTTPMATDVVLSVRGGTLFSAEQLARVRATPGVAEAVGRVESTVRLRGVQRSHLTVVSDPGSGPLSRIRLVSGAYPAGHGEVAVDSRTAGRLSVSAGSRIALESGEVRVTGVVDAPADPGERAYTPDFVAAALGGTEYPRIDIRAASPVAARQLTSGLSQVVDPGQTVPMSIRSGAAARAAEVKDAARQMDRVFELIAMFVVVSVGAAALVATATFRIVFAQRMRQLALLRAVGAQPGQLVRALLVEGAVVGLVAGVAGVVAAQGAGYLAVVVARSAGTALPMPDVPVGAGIGVVIGAVLLTVAAVTAPAFGAAKAAPLQAFRTSSTLSAESRIGAYRLVLGLVLGVAAVGSVAVLVGSWPSTEPDGDSGLALLALAAMATFGALIALGPVVVRPVLAAVSWPLRRFSTVGSLATGGVGAAPRRAAGVSVVVALGVALIVATIVGTSGMTAYLDAKLAMRAPADLIASGSDAGVDAAQVAALRGDPALVDVTAFRTAEVPIGSMSGLAVDLDPAALPVLRSLLEAPRPGEVVLAQWAADSLGVGVGSRASLGPLSLTVRAVLTADGPFASAALLSPTDLDRLGASAPVVLANARGSGETGLITARDAVRRLVPGTDVSLLADARTQATGQVAGLLAVALGLLGLTVLIAVVGVGTTTALSVHERTGEIGLLRALGLSRGGVRTMIASEAGLYGAIGAALGLVLGVPFAWLAVSALDLGVPLTLPLGQLLVVVAALVVIAAAAGLLPAWRAARVSPVAALATE